MMQQLLDEIHNGGSLETGLLAARLGTTPQMVTAMLEHLQRLGLVTDYVKCEDGCGGCSLSDGCNHQATVRLWQHS